MGRIRIDDGIGAACGLGAIVAWGVAAVLMLARTQLSRSLVSRPDRWFGWDGAPFTIRIAIVTVCAAVLLGAFALRLAHAFADRLGSRAMGLLVAAAALGCAISSALVALFPVDAQLYTTSPIRGAAALVFVICAVVASVMAGVLLTVAGRVVVGLISYAIGMVAIWVSITTSLAGAFAGAAQPQLLAFVPVQVLAAAWTGLLATWLALAVRPAGDRVAAASARSGGARRSLLGTLMLLAGLATAAVVSATSVGSAAPVVGAEIAGRIGAESIRVGSVVRTYRLYRPVTVQAHPALVVALHGVFGSGFQIERNSSLDAQADRLGWLVAYPDGVSDGWSSFGTTPYWGQHPGADDVAFIAALIDRVEATEAVDPGRVFVTGMSRGGMMTHRVGCELADRVAAIAPVSGNMATATGSAADVTCRPSRPVSVLAVHGTADRTIPYAGGHVDIDFAPFEDVIGKWRSVERCDGAAMVSTEGSATMTSWHCADGTVVASRVIAGGGHDWPAGIDRVIVDFFAAHGRD